VGIFEDNLIMRKGGCIRKLFGLCRKR